MLSPADKVKDVDDVDHETYRGDEVDLDDYLRGLIAVSLPVKVVCGEDCKGLCPKCGANLNRETCDCEKQWEDPRFAVLKKLKIINYEVRYRENEKWDFRKENIPGPGPGKTEPTIKLRVPVFPSARTAASTSPRTGRAPAAGSTRERHT